MKRCPECRRDYVDDSLFFCLEDGTALVQGSVPSPDGPQTAILHEAAPPSEAATRAQIHTTAQTAGLSSGAPDTSKAPGFDKRLILAPLALAVIALGGFFGYRYATQAKQIDSIAVMPFLNESGNRDIEYLSDGMTETLIKSLSQLPNLSVKARSTVFAYKGKQTSARSIGDELGVQAVLLGRVVQRGDDLKLSLELVNTQTQDVIWSEQYDRRQSDLVSLQSEIAQDVSSKLRSKLSGEDRQVLEKKYTNDPEAYRLYLQARFYLNKRVGKEYEKAEGFLRQAIARDPNFALGYVGLSEFIDDDDRPKAKEYILRALAIDNELSEAHAAYGYQLALDRDWAASERELTRAIELDPRNMRAHQWNGTRLMYVGHYQEALAAYDRAINLEPTLPDIRGNRGTCLAAAGRMDEAIAEMKKAIEIDPTYPWSHSALSFLYRMKGDHAAAVEERARSVELLDQPDRAARFRDSYRERGWVGYLNELLEQTSGQFTNEVRKASIYCELGRKEDAFAALERSAASGEWWLFSIKYDTAFDPIRDDPRFQKLLKEFDWPR
jgi:TolB-like protein